MENPARLNQRHYDELALRANPGHWPKGYSLKRIEDLSHKHGDILLTLVSASVEDVDDACRKASEHQPRGATAPQQNLCDLLLRASHNLVEHKDEIVGWLVHETGNTRMKASIDWQLVHEGMLEAATYPFRMTGEMLPRDFWGEEALLYLRPLTVGVSISSRDSPRQRTNRPAIPALAVTDVVVHKSASPAPITHVLLHEKTYEETGLPPGFLRVVAGHTAAISDAFITYPFHDSSRLRAVWRWAVTSAHIQDSP